MTTKNLPLVKHCKHGALLGTVAAAAILAAVPHAALSTVLVDPDGTGASTVFPNLTTNPVSTSQINVGFSGFRGAVEVNASVAGNGITAIAGSALFIGQENGADGLVRITGNGTAGSAKATIDNGANVRIGFGGNGMLQVSNGGLLESNEQIHFGEESFPAGIRGSSTVTVDGTTSVIRSNPRPGQFAGGRLMIPFGLADTTVTVSNGGAMEAIGGNPLASEDGSVFIGSEVDRPVSADVTVTGVGSRITATHFLGLRTGFGNTQVKVLDGAKVEVTDVYNVSFQPTPFESMGINALDGNARLTVDGVSSGGTAASVTTAGGINVGESRGFFGFTAAGEPRYLFADPAAAGDQITDQQGNALFHGDGTPVLAEAQVFGSFTVLTLDQQQRDARISAPGHLEVLNGAVVQSGGDVVISPQAGAGLTLQAPFGGGSSSVTVASGGTLQANNVIVNPFGLLTGNGGTITGNVILNGGTIAPGSSPGTMFIDGDLDILNGLLEIEIGGATAGLFDQLIVTGDLISLGDLDLEISFINGYLPAVGDSFAFLDILGDSSALDLQLVDLTVLGLDPSLVATLGMSPGGLTVTTSAGNGAPAVPVPATLPLLASVVAGFWGFHARRQRRKG